MPDDAGLWNMASQLASTAANSIAVSSTNRQTRKWNDKQYKKVRADNLADWNMQNEYNSPQATMNRYKSAGLNPNLIYGQGTQSSAPVRSDTVQSYNPKTPDYSGVGLSLDAYFNAQIKQAQVDNLKAQNTIMLQDQALRAAQVTGQSIKNAQGYINTNYLHDTLSDREGIVNATRAGMQMRNDQAERLNPVLLESAAEHVRKIRADIDYTLNQNERAAAMTAMNLKTGQQSLIESAERVLNYRMQRAKSGAEIDHISQAIENLKKDAQIKDWDIYLKDNGLNQNDPVFLRMLNRLLPNN